MASAVMEREKVVSQTRFFEFLLTKAVPPLLVCFIGLFAVGCHAQTEEQALANLRSLTHDGQLPPENVVVDLERRFPGKRTGALARLVHARIRFEAGDFAGAA